MLENGTLRDLVPLIDNPSTYLSQRAIHTLTAFARYGNFKFLSLRCVLSLSLINTEDALPQIIEHDIVKILTETLERDSLVSDALQAITQLAGHGEPLLIHLRSCPSTKGKIHHQWILDELQDNLIQSGLFQQIVAILKRQNISLVERNLDNKPGKPK